MNRIPVLCLLVISAHGNASAQVTPFGPRPPADTIVTRVLDGGYVGPWGDHIRFQGCPQSDPVGQALVEGFDPGVLSDWIIGELADIWAPELATCGYGPLQEWYRAALHRVVDLRGSSWNRILHALPPNLAGVFTGDLTSIAADTTNPEWIREGALGAVSRLTSIDDRLTFFFDRLVDLTVSDRWVLYEGLALYEALGDQYIDRLTSEAPDLSDVAVSVAATPVLGALQDGTLAVSDPSVAAFLSSIEGREGLRVLSSVMTGEPIANGSTSLPVTADTYLRRGAPNQNQGSEEILRIRSSGNNRALVAVDSMALSGISGPVTQAYLEFDIVFNANNWGNEGRTVDAHRMLVPWTHYGATWNCADDLDPDDQSPDCPSRAWEMRTLDPSPYEPVASGTLLVTGDLTGTVSIDVTGDVNAMLAGQVPNYGWILRKTQEGQNGRIEIASSETGMGPRLVLVF